MLLSVIKQDIIKNIKIYKQIYTTTKNNKSRAIRILKTMVFSMLSERKYNKFLSFSNYKKRPKAMGL